MFDRKEYARKWYQKNKEKINKKTNQWRKNNPDKYRKKHREYQKKWKENNPEYLKEWSIKNKNNIDIKKYYKQWSAEKRITDLKYNLNRKISRGIYKSLKANKNGRHWEDLVGYSLNDLIRHLKKTMPENYNWNDYLQGKLHIDHIIPISVFNFDSPEQIDFQMCWALKNLQLLPASENLLKRDKLSKPFQPALKI
jgi:hypothetical protein